MMYIPPQGVRGYQQVWHALFGHVWPKADVTGYVTCVCGVRSYVWVPRKPLKIYRHARR